MKISRLINMKMPTILGIFIFISRENFMLCGDEHEISFITLAPDRGTATEILSWNGQQQNCWGGGRAWVEVG